MTGKADVGLADPINDARRCYDRSKVFHQGLKYLVMSDIHQ